MGQTVAEGKHEGLLSTRGVVVFWLIYAASLLVVQSLLAPGRTLQDAIEAELLQNHLAGGYQLKNPPLYEWALWAVQRILGAGPLSYLVLRYALLAATGILFYYALIPVTSDKRLAAAFSMSLILFYWFGWESHHNVSHSLILFVVTLVFWLMLQDYMERQTVPRAAGLGLTIGLGVMAKWSFLLVLASFAIALALDPSGRRVYQDRRSLLILLIAVLPIIPFALWAIQLDQAQVTLHSTRGGNLGGMLSKETKLLGSIPLLFLPWILIVSFMAWRFPKPKSENDRPNSVSRLA
jgi:4-amino-4-deoxy-L-arabinose transferase-like glycosyltransferase